MFASVMAAEKDVTLGNIKLHYVDTELHTVLLGAASWLENYHWDITDRGITMSSSMLDIWAHHFGLIF